MVNQDKINEALLYAAVKHDGQRMKQPDVSYVSHLQGVCLEAINGCVNGNVSVDLEKVIILALLHDTIEDTDATFEEIKDKFGEEIANGVLALTKNSNMPCNEQMADSLKRIKLQGKEVAIVKLADRLFNLKDIPACWDGIKIQEYSDEAKLILEELGTYNPFMAERLKLKIEKYHL